MLAMVRKQMDGLEDKVTGHVARIQQQSDRLRDAALARVDSKMSTMETLQPKLDRRLAELSGNYKGISDEMQAQIRRIDQMESRLWEWRHQLEEEIRGKFAETEQNFQRVAASVRIANASNEDALKRHAARVLRAEDRLAAHDDATRSLMDLHQQVADLEDRNQAQEALMSIESRDLMPPASRDLGPDSGGADRATVAALEARLHDIAQKMEHMVEESHDIHTRVEVHEERLKTFRTLCEDQESRYRALSDRVERSDWDGRLKELQHSTQLTDQQRSEQTDQIDLLRKKVFANETAFEEQGEQLRRLQERVAAAIVDHDGDARDVIRDALSFNMGVNIGGGDEAPLPANLREWMESVKADLQTVRADTELAPRVATLVGQLTDLAPRVIDQEKCVRSLLERVSRVEEKCRIGKASEPGASDAVSARVTRLEVEVERLCAEVECDRSEELRGRDEAPDLDGAGYVSAANANRRASATE
eukprot:NODE_200_length_1824_cov_289.295647.p1 GENE.NODE_200_length_1824_cov_289.295647~~NODE_200_length_1824_cov_289.295647.p1  ORF type:complete len:534 (-),score=156.61 NODE_200_length_1824_cov_289.295647:206-1636(-)